MKQELDAIRQQIKDVVHVTRDNQKEVIKKIDTLESTNNIL